MKILEFIQTRMLSIADWAVEPRNYSYSKDGGFERDRLRLSGDVKNVGKDIKVAIENYGRTQSHY